LQPETIFFIYFPLNSRAPILYGFDSDGAMLPQRVFRKAPHWKTNPYLEFATTEDESPADIRSTLQGNDTLKGVFYSPVRPKALSSLQPHV